MQTTIYIRKHNIARWEAIEDKSAWVNERLGTAPGGTVKKVSIFKEMGKPIPANPDASIIHPPTPVKQGEKLCKHGFVLSSRMCKYGCRWQTPALWDTEANTHS